jgi:hypothetical protein
MIGEVDREGEEEVSDMKRVVRISSHHKNY